MGKFAAVICLWLACGFAFAVSCVPQTPERFFGFLAGAEDRVLAFGTLERLGPAPVYNPETLEYEPAAYGANFAGFLGTEAGFDQPAEFPVTVRHQCHDEACGAIPAEVPGVIQLDQVPGGYEFTSHLCNETLLSSPTQEDLDWLTGCLATNGCTGTEGSWALAAEPAALTLSFLPDGGGDPLLTLQCQPPASTITFYIPYWSELIPAGSPIAVTFVSGPAYFRVSAEFDQLDEHGTSGASGTLTWSELTELLLGSDTLVAHIEHNMLELPLDPVSDAATIDFLGCRQG